MRQYEAELFERLDAEAYQRYKHRMIKGREFRKLGDMIRGIVVDWDQTGVTMKVPRIHEDADWEVVNMRWHEVSIWFEYEEQQYQASKKSQHHSPTKHKPEPDLSLRGWSVVVSLSKLYKRLRNRRKS